MTSGLETERHKRKKEVEVEAEKWCNNEGGFDNLTRHPRRSTKLVRKEGAQVSTRADARSEMEKGREKWEGKDDTH